MSALQPAVPQAVAFGKYAASGAYHWEECERRSRLYNPPLFARYEVLVKRITDASRVLDVGCGDGYLMGRVSPRSREVFGVESDRSGVELARHMLRPFTNCSVVQGNCYSLPFREGFFDTILLADVIEHLEEPDLCLQEVRRVIASNGVFMVTTPKWRPDRRWDANHVREYKPEELAESLSPHFSEVKLSFFWPLEWSNRYSTLVGWRLIRILARHFHNPFLREGTAPRPFGQILAICRHPRR